MPARLTYLPLPKGVVAAAAAALVGGIERISQVVVNQEAAAAEAEAAAAEGEKGEEGGVEGEEGGRLRPCAFPSLA